MIVTTDTRLDAVIAANRFGLGARPGDLKHIAGDPRGWLESQCMGKQELPVELAGLPDTRQIFQSDDTPTRTREDIYRKYVPLRVLAAVNSDTPFLERLVLFWSNHFTISTQTNGVNRYAEVFEREAIRPNILGSFVDMLLAATGHPAMQLYLDNWFSHGPNSFLGGNLNENHAREILELHTMGESGGYTPKDLREFALMLTGWGVVGRTEQVANNPHRLPSPPKDRAAFAFNPDLHEPGPKWLFGKVIRGAGVREAEEALRMIAAHPSTAQFVATKLARHFVADNPPAESVARLAETFRRTNGDLREVTLALIHDPLVWGNYLNKVKSPAELVISAARAIDFHGESAEPLIQAMDDLGQRPFYANSPAGFPDTIDEWMGGQAMLDRIDFCADASKRARVSLSPPALARDILGPAFGVASIRRIAGAPSVAQGIGLTLASPEFQRR